ncbi:hypothetical protein CXB51_019755 [Gossypium anomalum]|uniref:Uncharacterized protein n=1 Tax=Gossypium anomalum TaxID=47600 RepID=A0A8J5YAW0_9ROSI|nr:hypothetical protein CXB51_019755 [Gossypium anomalum]
MLLPSMKSSPSFFTYFFGDGMSISNYHACCWAFNFMRQILGERGLPRRSSLWNEKGGSGIRSIASSYFQTLKHMDPWGFAFVVKISGTAPSNIAPKTTATLDFYIDIC